MKKVYTKIDKCNPEIIQELAEQKNIFWRFHDPERRMSSRSKSWGMIYSSEREAIQDGSTILNGKSCEKYPENLMKWADCFDNSHVVIAFLGYDTRETGHDGEYVATYYQKIKTFNYDDFVKCFEYVDFSIGHSGWQIAA